jgi:hypothetical protein
MKYDIKHCYTGEVQFTADIECFDECDSSKNGLAVRWAIKNGADLTCANLTRADLTGANLTGADLTGANLTGADLTSADLTSADLTGANLTGADLTGAALVGTTLIVANLTRADLTGAALVGTVLTGANLTGAALVGTTLVGANLTGAALTSADLADAYMFDVTWGDAPVVKDIHKKVYASVMVENTFDMGDWGITNGAKCGTTMCRAGHVVSIAGAEGVELSTKIGIPSAALAIYAVSDPEYFARDGIPDFFTNNEIALADMERLAGI